MSNQRLTKKQMILAFKDHDINDTGELDADHLLMALLSLNLPVEQSDIPDLFECVGREKDKAVNMDDFMDIVTELKGVDDTDDFLEYNDTPTAETAFQMLVDPNVNGITLESLLRVCATQEESWTKQQITEMMNEADLNHDGKIDPIEFKLICKKVGLS
ncbi:hypothetical protein EDC94DRAFT_605404 [Helicostylum pulchrum]|uniref:EF-hand domain-containing protein n=1 Tax=Helicostylum pulchrum TaxID=562976 RepID=A0ABP9YFL7_9FUNG|nr:hypothetical protein EDC94DRAFT_605404 [Helicostylum pulchrum]